MSQLQQVEQKLRDMILGLEIGPGERLTERWIETRFEASRTPVRAALLHLEAEGLVCRDGRGWIVAPIDIDELAHLFVYREVVEVAAVRLTCAAATAAQTTLNGLDEVAAMLQSCGPESSNEEWHRVGVDFHTLLARLSGNPYLSQGVQKAMTLLSRARWLEVRLEPARDRALNEHLAILAAVRAGRAEVAADLLGAHIRGSRERLLASLKDNRRSLRARGFKVVAG